LENKTFFQLLLHFSVEALSMVQLLIQFGANVDEVDPILKATPLHLIARCDDVDHAQPLMRVLLDANAHSDYLDLNGRQPEDLTTNVELKDFLQVNRRLSLKCNCAHPIHSKKIYYGNYLSSNQIAFVKMHTANEIDSNDRSIRVAIMRYTSIQYNTLPRYRSIFGKS